MYPACVTSDYIILQTLLELHQVQEQLLLRAEQWGETKDKYDYQSVNSVSIQNKTCVCFLLLGLQLV